MIRYVICKVSVIAGVFEALVAVQGARAYRKELRRLGVCANLRPRLLVSISSLMSLESFEMFSSRPSLRYAALPIVSSGDEPVVENPALDIRNKGSRERSKAVRRDTRLVHP